MANQRKRGPSSRASGRLRLVADSAPPRVPISLETLLELYPGFFTDLSSADWASGRLPPRQWIDCEFRVSLSRGGPSVFVEALDLDWRLLWPVLETHAAKRLRAFVEQASLRN